MNWLSPVTNVIKTAFEHRAKIKEAKLNVELARYQAEAKLAERALERQEDYDLEAMKQMSKSWKDEFLIVLLSLPFLGSFIPQLQEYVAKGWAYVYNTPYWYQVCFVGVIAGTFGLRWWFNGKKLLKGSKDG